MPVRHYSLFKGWVVERKLATYKNPHYQIHAEDMANDYRISINVFSSLNQFRNYSKTLSLVEFVLIEDFKHPLTAKLEELEPGLYPLNKPGDPQTEGLALDYIRGNYFDRNLMKPVPFNLPGPNNDLNEYLDGAINQALAERNSFIYAFGSHWGPEKWRDKIFGFRPGNGLHNIHMNQGNEPGRFAGDNGVWQDGGLFLYLAAKKRWLAVFLKFQQQSWDTLDVSGKPKEEPPAHYKGWGKKEKFRKQTPPFPRTHRGARKPWKLKRHNRHGR